MSISAIKKLRGLARSESRGFTLIELLIVIAVLGVLAAGVLIAINPAEQLARARDSSRKTAVGQLAKAAQAYYTSQGTYMAASSTWIGTLTSAGEVKSVPSAVSAAGYSNCSTWAHNGFCYNINGTTSEAIVYTKLESTSERTKAACVSADPAYFVWASGVSKSGVYCGASEPTVGVAASELK